MKEVELRVPWFRGGGGGVKRGKTLGDVLRKEGKGKGNREWQVNKRGGGAFGNNRNCG